jgi:hypothetical protein
MVRECKSPRSIVLHNSLYKPIFGVNIINGMLILCLPALCLPAGRHSVRHTQDERLNEPPRDATPTLRYARKHGNDGRNLVFVTCIAMVNYQSSDVSLTRKNIRCSFGEEECEAFIE